MDEPEFRSLSAAYVFLALALFLQSTAAGMVQMAVYGSLVSMTVSKVFFGLAFAVSILPGLILGIFADRLAALHKSYTVLLGAGAIILCMACTVLALGLERNLPVLISMEAVSAAVVAMAVPIFQFSTKSVTEKAMSLKTALRIETFVLSGSVIFGVGFGALFFDALGTVFYLKAVAALFLFSLLLIIYSCRSGPELYAYESVSEGSLRKGLRLIHSALKQDREKMGIFLFMPSLALFTTPLIAALPAIEEVKNRNITLDGIVLPLSLALLFMRSLGQLLGPLLVNQKALDILSQRNGAVVALICTFFALYTTGFTASITGISCLSIFAAHLCTNILWAKNYCDMQTRFSKSEIGLTAATQAQVTQIIMIAGGITGTVMLESYGLRGLLAICCLFLVAPVLTTLSRRG